MDALNRNARIAGLLYLGLALLGPIYLIYIPNVLFVPGDAVATTHNIASHEALLRLGVFVTIVGSTLEIFLGLALFRLFRNVDQPMALLLLVLALVSVPISFLNELNSIGALVFAQGAPFLSAFSAAQREAMVLVFVTLHHYGNIVNEVFWGLWLLPMGILTYKSGFLPRTIGIWLVLNCFAYLAQNVAGILFPQYLGTIENVAFPVQFGEIAFMLWLLIMGAKPRLSFARATT